MMPSPILQQYFPQHYSQLNANDTMNVQPRPWIRPPPGVSVPVLGRCQMSTPLRPQAASAEASFFVTPPFPGPGSSQELVYPSVSPAIPFAAPRFASLSSPNPEAPLDISLSNVTRGDSVHSASAQSSTIPSITADDIQILPDLLAQLTD